MDAGRASERRGFRTRLTFNRDGHAAPALRYKLICRRGYSPQVTVLGRLSSQDNTSMGYARILARAVSNPGLQF